jgi:hypothetical protein
MASRSRAWQSRSTLARRLAFKGLAIAQYTGTQTRVNHLAAGFASGQVRWLAAVENAGAPFCSSSGSCGLRKLAVLLRCLVNTPQQNISW